MDSATVSFLQILRNRIDELVANGDFDEAIHAATASVEKAQQSLTNESENIGAFCDAVEVRADLFRQVGRFDEARDDYRQAIMLLEEREDHEAQLGRLHAGLGAVFDAWGRSDDAARHWRQAVDYFEAMDPPAWLDVAAMCNNLAFLRRSAGDLTEAESCFLKALEITHREFGPHHQETALLCNNLGACYQAGGFLEQAREMHLMALEAREQLLGPNHPDTAQSHNNLALTLAMTGDVDAATEHFHKALDGFEAAGEESREDFEAVAANFAAFLRQQGNDELAANLESRTGVVAVA